MASKLLPRRLQLRPRRFVARRAVPPAPCSVRRPLPAIPAERPSTAARRCQALLLQHILGARDRIAQRAVGVVENGRRIQRAAARSAALAAEAVRVPLAAELVEALLQIVRDSSSARAFRLRAPSSIRRYSHPAVAVTAENDVPQPQLFLAFGLSKTKPDCISESFQSSVMPSRNTMLLGSMKTLTSSKSKTWSVGRGFGVELELIAQAGAAAAEHAEAQPARDALALRRPRGFSSTALGVTVDHRRFIDVATAVGLRAAARPSSCSRRWPP